MQNLYDYKKFAVLYVDDEEKSLKYFTRAFQDQFRILTATNAQDGLKLLEEHKDEIGLLMTDQRMPGEKGVWLLEKARQLRPRIIRILATAYADMDAAIAAVNTGAIYKYVTKPWDPPQLENTLKRGLEFFMVQRERDQLLKEKMSVLHNMMIADRIVSLGLLAAGLSHHIRNSLVAVKTFLDLAPAKMEEEKMDLDGLRNPDFWKEYYQNVQGQIEKINNMLKDLWTASEKPAFEFGDRVHLHEVVADTVAAAQRRVRGQEHPGGKPHPRLPAGAERGQAEVLPAVRIAAQGRNRQPAGGQPGHPLGHAAQRRPGGQTGDPGAGQRQRARAAQGSLAAGVRSVCGPQRQPDGIRHPPDGLLFHRPSSRRAHRCQERGGAGHDLHLASARSIPTRPHRHRTKQEFLQKVLLNETLWEKLISSE